MFFIGVIIVRRLLFIRITEKGMKFLEQITAGFKKAFLEENTSVKTIKKLMKFFCLYKNC